MSESLLPPRFLFRFSAPLRQREPLWQEHGPGLGEEFRLPNLAELEGESAYADVRAAWSSEGLLFSVEVAGKEQPLWCRDTRLEDSDGLQVWIDTRDTHNIHRASKYCHRFAFLPAGAGRAHDRAAADQLVIARAKENAPPYRPRDLQVKSVVRKDGYRLAAFIAAGALNGFDPAEHPRLGFTYALLDRERGLQTFSVGMGFPYEEDPSTWGTLEMVA
ncbi:MAG: hypothetical protein KDA42_11470 [Planctomycetales bacterium]|nr:hypothetical protein [Planctomycetales bacterium]